MTHSSSDDAGVPYHSTQTYEIGIGYRKEFAIPFSCCISSAQRRRRAAAWIIL